MTLSPICLCCAVLFAAGCSRSNNLLMGRVEATVGTHTVVVTDCYRTSVPNPEKIFDARREIAYRFTPCRDADVSIHADQLVVNGRAYGHMNPTDSVLVDHGIVSINKPD